MRKISANCALCVLAVASGASAAPRFREVPWPAGPRITDRVAVDLDGDLAKDLVIVRGREVSIHLQTETGFDPERPSQRFNFVDKAILWDTGDVDGDGRDEILFLTGDGVAFYRWAGGRLSFVPNDLLKTDSILKTPSQQEVRLKDFHADLDGDREPDLLLPGDGGFVLHRGFGGGRFTEAQWLEMRPDVWIEGGGEPPMAQAVSTWWYPQAFAGDWDGDGKRDIFVHQREQVLLFMRGESGRYGPAPTLVLPLKFTGPLEEGRFKFDIQLPTRFADIDADGLADIIATHIGRATTYVFKGKPGRADLARPESILRFPGITFVNFLVDLDGDGRQDLVIARTDRPGVLDILKVLITKEIPVEVNFFFARAGTMPYPAEPDYRREIEIPILFSSAKRGVNVGTSAVLSLLGDFTGDGKNDMLLRASDRKIAVYANQGRSFSDDPVQHLEVRSMDGFRFLEPIAEDLNDDGVSDLILTYFSWDGKGDQLSVVLSQGRARRTPMRPPANGGAGGPASGGAPMAPASASEGR